LALLLIRAAENGVSDAWRNLPPLTAAMKLLA
jgi:hypothetical protein